MKDTGKTKKQLINEFVVMRQRITDMEALCSEGKKVKKELQKSFEKLQRNIYNTIYTIVKIVEMRDPYTVIHQQRVANLASSIAREMGLPSEQIEGIRVAGMLHDIGKISIPVEILTKPGKINEYEFSIIRTHPQVGYEILKSIEFPFSWPVAQIVLQHHERLDGSGYPQGLSGEEIILETRILSVADVVEAMASHRPYRPANDVEKTLEEISKNKGIIYDPEVVDACMRLFSEKGFELLSVKR